MQHPGFVLSNRYIYNLDQAYRLFESRRDRLLTTHIPSTHLPADPLFEARLDIARYIAAYSLHNPFDQNNGLSNYTRL